MLRRVDYAAIKPWASAAARDRVATADSPATRWFMWGENNEQPAFCGLLQTSSGYRIKGVWTHPKLRGQGIGTAMTNALIKYATDELMACRVEAFAYNPGWYEQQGFKRFGVLPNGAVKVHKHF